MRFIFKYFGLGFALTIGLVLVNLIVEANKTINTEPKAPELAKVDPNTLNIEQSKLYTDDKKVSIFASIKNRSDIRIAQAKINVKFFDQEGTFLICKHIAWGVLAERSREVIVNCPFDSQFLPEGSDYEIVIYEARVKEYL